MASDDQLIHHDPAAVRHADDTLAFTESSDPKTLPRIAELKWISQPSEHADHPGQLLATRSRDVIAFWAQARRAKPALLTSADRSDPEQALRFQVSDRRESEYALIPWPEWFQMMADADLVFVYQERTANGDASDVFKLIPAASVTR